MLSLPEKFLLEILGPYVIKLGWPPAVHFGLHIEDVADMPPVIVMVPKQD